MGTTLVFCLLLATHVHARIIGNSSDATLISESETATSDVSAEGNKSYSFFDVDDELSKIAASCLSSRNYEQLTGNVIRHGVARMFSPTLITESVVTIGLTELRSTLKFAPLGPWKRNNNTEPSDDELASAPTIESYYDLKEPRSKMRSLDSLFLFEQNVSTAIAYLDKRFPSIRTIFKLKFEKIRRSFPKALDKKTIDHMIVEYVAISEKLSEAIKQMRHNDDKCWEDGE